MARHADAGDDVHVLVVTRGVPELFDPEVIERTRRELAQAHAILGVSSVQFLDMPAPKLDTVPLHQIADSIRQVLGKLQPSIVYCPYQGDLHSDHKSVFWATMVAVRPLDNHRVSRVLCYETLSETEWAAPIASNTFTPTVYADITTTLKSKLRACRCYRSQMKLFPHPRSLRAIAALARLRGSTVGFPAAESFVLIREITV